VARRKYNHRALITNAQPGILKAIHPGMFISFKYRKSTVFDTNPLLLVLHKDYRENLVHGLNINYLTVHNIKQVLSSIIMGAGVYSKKSINVITQEDQTEDYDDTLPYRNLLKEPYTRITLPVFKEQREGNPLSKSEAKRQSEVLYKKVIKRQMTLKNFKIYRTYHINLLSNIKVLQLSLQ